MIIDLEGCQRDGSTPAGTIAPLLPVVQDLVWPRAEDGTIRLTVKTQDFAPADLTGAAIIFAVRKYSTDASPAVSREATITDAVNGEAEILIVQADTVSLKEEVGYRYDVQLIDLDGARWQLIPDSRFFIAPIVAQPGEDVTVPAAQAPLAIGPEGPAGPPGPSIPVGPGALVEGAIVVGDNGTGITGDVGKGYIDPTTGYVGFGTNSPDNAIHAKSDTDQRVLHIQGIARGELKLSSESFFGRISMEQSALGPMEYTCAGGHDIYQDLRVRGTITEDSPRLRSKKWHDYLRALAGFTTQETGFFWEDFDFIDTANSQAGKFHTNGANSAIICPDNRPGGIVRLPTAGGGHCRIDSWSPIVANTRTSRWALAAKVTFKKADIRSYVSLFNIAQNKSLSFGYFAALDANNYIMQYDGDRAGQFVVLGAADEAEHIFFIWSDATDLRGKMGTGGTTVIASPAPAAEAADSSFINAQAYDGDGTSLPMDIDWIACVYPTD